MSGTDDAKEVLRSARTLLADLMADGIDYLPRPRPAEGAEEETAEETVGPPEPGLFDPRERETLEQIRADLGDCERCGLSRDRTNIVFGEGNPRAKVVFVGEGPGAEEDRTGRPFVGRAGELLDKIIASVGWRREDVYICNIVKCRPPKNRTPLPPPIP